MSNAVVALISIALVLAGVSLMTQSSLKSMDMLSDAWKQMEVRSGDVARTGIEVLDADRVSPSSSGLVDATVRNAGQTALRDFESWDIVVQYEAGNGTYHVTRLTYTTSASPGNNQWTVSGIYASATSPVVAEAVQPGILDPDEEAVIRLHLQPAPDARETGYVVIGTPNGVSAGANF